jgi:hypothetical protein
MKNQVEDTQICVFSKLSLSKISKKYTISIKTAFMPQKRQFWGTIMDI